LQKTGIRSDFSPLIAATSLSIPVIMTAPAQRVR
jgi:hypothetical protein